MLRCFRLQMHGESCEEEPEVTSPAQLFTVGWIAVRSTRSAWALECMYPGSRFRRLLAGASAGNPSEANSSWDPRETVRRILRQDPQPMFVQPAKLIAILKLRQAELRFSAAH